MPAFSIAVDIGGTFTDVVLRHVDGRAWVDKTLTTHHDLLVGFFMAVESVLRQAAISPTDVDDVIVHATTLVTNCVLERKGARTALLTTKGFSDVLEIRQEARTNVFDNQLELVEPLVPSELTFGIKERAYADATIAKRVDPEEVRASAAELLKHGVQSVAVCFLNAYANPENERQVGAILKEAAPGLFISLSSDVAPQIREYARTSTTVINAYTVPIVQPYLNRLAKSLADKGFRQRPLIMLSSGGLIGADTAGQYPVRMIESGPAAGALAARHFSALMGIPNLLGFDVGGTTAKACFIENGMPLVTNSFEVAQEYRFERGSGLPLLVTTIDMIEIGAGGGSIAKLDELGLLSVGPQSAGSDPGPACYGRDGQSPTVTDADLVLGMLDASNFLGGDMKLDLPAARRAIGNIAERMQASVEDTALGIYKMVSESMAEAIRAHAADRGTDWQGLSLLAFGGAGPVHACYVGELIDAHCVIFPPLASVLSAFGTLVTPPSLDLARGEVSCLRDLDWTMVERLRDEMLAEGHSALVQAGCRPDEIGHTVSADMRYLGQQNDLNVEIPASYVNARNIESIRELFEQSYERRYQVRLADVELEIVTWRVKVFGATHEARDLKLLRQGTPKPDRRRRVIFPSGPHDTPVLARSHLPEGKTFKGPTIIEERETTLVIPPGWSFVVDRSGCVISERNRADLREQPGRTHETADA